MKRTNAGKQRKLLAARVLCGLLLGAYLTGGYCMPVAWGASAESTQIFEDGAHGDKSKVASAWGANTTANNTASTAFGANTNASGEYSTAFGNGTVASGSIATAWGNSAKAYGYYSTAFGKGTAGDKDDNNKGEFATAWGDSTVASGDTATVWGYHAKASGDFSTAFGFYTNASGMNSTSFGDTTEARGENATAWGLKAKAYGVNSTSLGYNTVAGGDGATAFGGGAMALGFYSTAWGYYTQAGQLLYGSDNTVAYIVDYTEGGTTKYKIVDYNNPETTLKGGFSSYWEAYKECNVKDAVQATAWGAGTKALAGNATAFGNGSIASGIRSTAFGWFTEASGEGSTTWGIDSVASGNGATAWGGYTAGMNQVKGGTASGTASTAFGVETIANTKGSTAWGDQTLAGKATIDGTEYSGTYATAFGYGTKASGTYATAFGSLTTASGPVATAWGVGTKASGNRSTAFGDNTTASGFAATAWGTFAIASGKASTAFGDSSQAMAENSLAALGGTTEATATNSAAIGNGAKVTVADTVALGSGSEASRAAGATDAYMKGSNTGSAWVSTHNAIAVGNDDTATRQITGVAAGSKDTDAVNVAQLKAARTETSATLGLMGSYINDLQALTAGFPEGKTIKQTMDEGLDTKANKDMDNLTEAGKTVVKDLAKGAVNVVGEGPVSVVKSDVSGVDTYTVSVKADGKVEDGDTGLVTGGTVYTAISANASSISALDSRVTAAENAVATNISNISALDGRVTANEGNISANTSSISALDGRVTANEGNISANTSSISALDSRVTQNETDIADTKAAIGTTADGTYVKESNTVGENLNALDNQVAALAGGAGADIAALSNRISSVDSKVNKVGAGAAALAALHPIDTDSKFTMGAGFGSYRSANAMALGMFYRPTDQVMLSIGGAMGNGENMINAGISFALDKGVNTSKAAMARKIAAQDEKIAAQDAELKAQKKENEEQKAEIRALKEALARIEAKFGK